MFPKARTAYEWTDPRTAVSIPLVPSVLQTTLRIFVVGVKPSHARRQKCQDKTNKHTQMRHCVFAHTHERKEVATRRLLAVEHSSQPPRKNKAKRENDDEEGDKATTLLLHNLGHNKQPIRGVQEPRTRQLWTRKSGCSMMVEPIKK